MERTLVPADTGGLVVSEPDGPSSIRKDGGSPDEPLYPGGPPRSLSRGEPDEPDARVTGIPDYPTAGG